MVGTRPEELVQVELLVNVGDDLSSEGSAVHRSGRVAYSLRHVHTRLCLDDRVQVESDFQQ